MCVFLDIVQEKQVELAHVVVGSLWNVTAKSLIILRNVRTHWIRLGLTVQGLMNSKPCFLGCLICNSWSLIFLSLFKNPFSSLIEGRNVACNRSVTRECLSQNLVPCGGASEVYVFRVVPLQGLLLKCGGSLSMCETPREGHTDQYWVPIFLLQRRLSFLFSLDYLQWDNCLRTCLFFQKASLKTNQTYAKWNKSVTKEHRLYDSIYMNYLEQQIHRQQID